MATENDVQQTLSDIPTWLFVLVSMAGLSGELWRAEAAGLTVSDLLKRVLLRSGASVVFGLASVLLATASGAGLPVAAALGSVVACLGADVTSGFYTRWLARRAGMPPAGDEQRGGPASPPENPDFLGPSPVPGPIRVRGLAFSL